MTYKQKLDEMRKQRDELLKELGRMVYAYVDLVTSGDCGNWDPETDDCIISARKVLEGSNA